MEIETQIGDYTVNYMVFPAFPKAGQRGRINLYAAHLDTGQAYSGEVRFKVRNDSWFSNAEEIIGTQQPDDFVFRQGFEFSVDGDYIITADFVANGEPYTIDFPLRVGAPVGIGPLGIAVAAIVLVLLSVSVMQRRKKVGSRVRREKKEKQEDQENQDKQV
jgi:heme exporter protein D